MRRLDFSDHRRQLGDNRYVYAVVSRRAGGLSIGINLNPDKVCNFDCPYCQVDRTPAGLSGTRPGVETEVVAGELAGLLQWTVDGSLWTRAPFDSAAPAFRKVVDIAFAGDGEPTSSRAFAASAHAVRATRDAVGLSVPIRLLTNATLLDRERVIAGLDAIDEVWAKLDAGTAAWFARVDGTRFSFERVLANITATARARPIVIQSMFVRLGDDAPDDAEINAWVGRLRDVLVAGGRISEVQVYSLARTPADAQVSALTSEQLQQIGNRARRLGLAVRVV